MVQRDRDHRKRKVCYLSTTAVVSEQAPALNRCLETSAFHYGAIGPAAFLGTSQTVRGQRAGITVNWTGQSFAQVLPPRAAFLQASRSHPLEPRFCLKNKKRFPGPLPRMACAISLTPMGSPSGPLIEKPLHQVDRLVWSMPLVLAFLSPKGEKIEIKNSTNQKWVSTCE